MFHAQCYIYKFEIRYLANVLYIVIFPQRKLVKKHGMLYPLLEVLSL